MPKILIADDDTTMLGLLTTLMELEGNQVVTVTRPEDIIPAVRREGPALILMDYHLAGGDAMGPLVELKQSEDLKRIPVVVTSGMDRETVCLRAGAESFLLKPFRPAQLLAKIHELSEP
ncbi:MAG: response regulator [Chloroflexi bacterium]|nr:response regulator [Chloroflexota bacterium]